MGWLAGRQAVRQAGGREGQTAGGQGRLAGQPGGRAVTSEARCSPFLAARVWRGQGQ